MLTTTQLQAAQSIVYRHMQPTATFNWPGLSNVLGAQLWLKHENHTPIGAFKVRGGLVFAENLAHSGFDGELVTATRGNHGQSIPYGACRIGLDVTVYVPHGNSREKNAAMRHWGANLVEFGRDFDEARLEAARVAQERGAMLVPSFDERLVQGVATYGAELFDGVDGLDRIYVPIGMGSGACSLIWLRDLLGLPTEIFGVVSSRADAMARSIEAGTIVETEDAKTFADGMATRVPHPQAFDIMAAGLAGVVRVSDEEIAQAIRLIFEHTHNVAEGAGAAAVAAALQQKDALSGKRVAAILTGGNIDREWFAQILNGGVPIPG
ncbi:MAG: threonine dehydratase [Pseudomonadota bacterium]